MKSLKVVLILIVAMLFCGTVSACDAPYTDYGNGVLYFHKASAHSPQFGCDYQEAGAVLSQYLTNHTEKHVVSMTADDFISYGLTGGFYVIVENKSVMKMSCVTNAWNGTRIGTPPLWIILV